MKGLVAYTDDSGNESESTAHDTAPPSANKTTAKAGARRIAHVIRRPPTNHRNQTRAHISTDTDGTSSQNHDLTHDNDASTSASPMDISNDEKVEGDVGEDDEMVKLRKVLQPPPILGVQDWGIPPASNDPVDPEIASKLTHFLTLKHTPQHPKHFNDSLMSSRSFRNPHLYANLVDWADVSDEKVSNFPVSVWDALGELEEGWFAENITEAQRKKADKIAASQGGKRSHIAFTNNNSTGSASSTSTSTIATRGVGAPGMAPGPSTGGRERFQPYGQIGGGAGGVGGGGASGRAKPTRWG